MIAGNTALIEPPRTASAISSNGVGCAFTITIFAPAERASFLALTHRALRNMEAGGR